MSTVGATLGALWSQALNYTLSVTGGTTYTHNLGYTPTIVLLTAFGVAATGTVPITFCYTAADTAKIVIVASPTTSGPGVDVLCGSFHSIIK